MTPAAVVSLSLIQKNVSRIVARFNDPASSLPGESTLLSEINDTVMLLLNIREEAHDIDLGGGLY